MSHDASPADAVEIVDARGLLCPLPIVRTARALAPRAAGSVVELHADDPGIVEDLPAWCAAMGHALLEMTEAAGTWRCRVRKGGKPPAE